MVVSAAKIEANRRNAQKSTGPRTEDGKERAKMNALKYGTRAETLVLPEEDPLELEARRAAWMASLGPCSELERHAVDQAVDYSWRQDRARRAEAGRADVRMADGGESWRAATKKAVADLGRRLFKDRLGPVAFYPLVADGPATMCTRAASTSYPLLQDDDADLPAVLVLELQETLIGCEWMLGEWARLQSVLDKRQPWISADKLKATRLLGRQPFDAIDDGDVAVIFLASYRLKPEKAEWAWEILTEMDEKNQKRFRSNAADRELESLMPADAAAARDALSALIQRETERLGATADAHRRRERVKAARFADLLAFDETPEGERLRRFEITSGRGCNRAIDTFLKLRRAESIGQLSIGPLSAVSGPLPLASDQWQVTSGQSATSEDTAVYENFTNELASASDVDISWALEYPGEGMKNEEGGQKSTDCARRDAPSEAADIRENATNEATAEGQKSEDRGPRNQNGERENVTNEATAEGQKSEDRGPRNQNGERENITNEATDSPSPIVVSRYSEEGFVEKPVAATDTNEANLGPLSVVSGPLLSDAQPPPGQYATESYADAIKRIRRTREEFVRKLNEQARKEAEAAMTARRARRRVQRSRNGIRADRPERSAGRSGQKTNAKAAATKVQRAGGGPEIAAWLEADGPPASSLARNLCTSNN